MVINAADPLNLIGNILPGKKVPSLATNRILFENGLPVAAFEKGVMSLLRPCLENEQEMYRQSLMNKQFPTRLRAYL